MAKEELECSFCGRKKPETNLLIGNHRGDGQARPPRRAGTLRQRPVAAGLLHRIAARWDRL